MPGILGTKIGMTRIVNDDGHAIPVTVVKCEPNTVVQIKTQEKDGYSAIVLAYRALKNPSKNRKYRFMREFQVENAEEFKVGDQVDVSVFASEDEDSHTMVTITGKSKGKGFQGVIKRHNFSRGPETHGSHHHRKPGSIGACAMPGRVAKGKKLPGRMGNKQTTVKQVPVMLVDKGENYIAIKGPVPGPINSLVKLTIE